MVHTIREEPWNESLKLLSTESQVLSLKDCQNTDDKTTSVEMCFM